MWKTSASTVNFKSEKNFQWSITFQIKFCILCSNLYPLIQLCRKLVQVNLLLFRCLLLFFTASQIVFRTDIFRKLTLGAPGITSVAPARKPYWIGPLLTCKNGDFGAISVTERSCAAQISKCRITYRIGQVRKAAGLL